MWGRFKNTLKPKPLRFCYDVASVSELSLWHSYVSLATGNYKNTPYPLFLPRYHTPARIGAAGLDVGRGGGAMPPRTS